MNLPASPRISLTTNWTPGQRVDLKSIWDDLSRALGVNAAAGAAALVDTHANRLALGAYDATLLTTGTLFFESDRNVWYIVEQVGGAGTWVYAAGTFRDVFSGRPSIADIGGTSSAGVLFYATDYTHTWRSNGTNWILEVELSAPMRGTITGPDQKPTLGTNDVGFRFYSTDFDRPYRWTGTAWVDGEAAPQRDIVHMCRTAPAGNGWHLCDGSANIPISKADGTTTTITVPAMNNSTFPRGAAAYSGPAATAAAAPTTVAHHHSVTVPDQNSGDESAHTHQVTIANNIDVTLLVGTNDGSAAQTVTSGAGSAHHHDVPSQTFNSGDFTTIVNADGLPKLMDFLPYIRL